MRILIATPFLPWPLNSGGNAAQFSTLKCLAEDHRFTVACPVYDEAGMANAKELQAQLPLIRVRAVFCGAERPPEPTPLIRVARSVVQFGRQLLNPPVPLPANKEEGAGKPTYAFEPLPNQFIVALQDELDKGVDLCQMEFVPMLSLGAWLSEQVPTLFVHHQVHFLYSTRFLDTCRHDSYPDYLHKMWEVQEIAYLQKFQGVITFSEEDRKQLLPHLAPGKLFTSPFPIPSDIGIADKVPAAFDGRFLFLASEEHGPNRDALEWFLTKIWPEIFRQLPSARLAVIGHWSESAKTKFAMPGVIFSGFVRDLPATLRGGIMVVPLRIGGGIRVKIMAAMAQGVPVVSTSVGSEGLLVRDGEELLVRDSESEFAAAAIQLANDAELRRRLSVAGKAAVAKHYSPEAVRRRRNEIYAALTQANPNSSPTASGTGKGDSRLKYA